MDGNDILAIYNATKYAREVAVNEQRPVLIEAMTLRCVEICHGACTIIWVMAKTKLGCL